VTRKSIEAEKLGTARESWAVLGSFAALRMTPQTEDKGDTSRKRNAAIGG
jgi:hypothetical protein